jgi:hypothetical protein
MNYNLFVQTVKNYKIININIVQNLPVRSCLSTASVTDLHDNVPGVTLQELSFLFFKNCAFNKSNNQDF